METIYDYLARDMANEIIGNYYKMTKNQVEMAVKNKKAFPDLSVQDAKRLLAELEANPLVLPDIENPGDTVETDLPTDYIVVDGPHPGYHVTYRPNIDPPVTMPSALYFVKESADELGSRAKSADKYKAVFLDSLLQNWEKQMSLFDPQSQHVVPQYPIWIETREEVLPSHIQEFLVVARDRGVFKPEELSVLYRAILPHIDMFPDLYNWTKNYKASEMHYEKLARTKAGDRGMYNRRDVQAATQLDKISKRHKLISEDQFQGVRKYNFIGSDRNALEISLFCLLKEIILKTHTLQMKDNKDFEWVFTNKPYSFNSKVCEQNDQIGKNPCNKCYQSKVIPNYSREVVNFN